MRIRDVTTAVVHANFDYTFVRITTDDGLYGTGECFMAPGISQVARDLGEVIVGCDPMEIAPCRSRLMAALSGSGGFSGAGMAYNALSGLDAALWDLRGKALLQPVASLLGGRFRDRVDVYADLHAGGELGSLDSVMRYRTPFWASPDGFTHTGEFFWEASEGDRIDPEEEVERARATVAAGFRRVKLDLDVFVQTRDTWDRSLSRAELLDISRRARMIRDALGDEVEIALDCHWRFDVPTALQVADAVAPMRPMWLEDPVPPDPAALAAVVAGSRVPIATGENTYLVQGFGELVRHGSAHILTPDVQKAGGITEVMKIAELANRHYLPIAPHCIASPVGFMAAAHVCAASPNAMCLEFHGIDVPFWNDLVATDQPLIQGGTVAVTEAPGLGVELDLDVVAAYSAPGEPVFDQVPIR